MEELVKLLNELYSKSGFCLPGDDGYDYFTEEAPHHDEIDALANSLLITDNGRCNWKNISILESKGYEVFAGEQDSFGWLTGCIQKKDDYRIFVYG